MCSAVDRLPAHEHLVDELGDDDRPVDRVGHQLAAGCGTFAGHRSALPLRAVAAAGLLAVRDAGRVERAADDLVTHARQVFHTAATHEHDRVLLQVVADAGDVRRDLDAAT